MAVYKVIQDIEAEDKLLGPLTFKGLIYAGITVAFGILNYQLITSGIPIFIKLPFIIIFSMPMALFGILASPLGRDQPTEVWLLARLKFFLKPRQRIWNQSGLSQLVTITAPKKLERILTKGYSQVEVQSRLKALATTLDSRGWVVKNVNVNLSAHPDYLMSTEDASDRLITASTMTREVPEVDIRANDDILDEANSPTAQKFQSMMAAAEQKRKVELAQKMEGSRVQSNPENIMHHEASQATKVTRTSSRQDEPAQSLEPPPEPLAVMGTTIIAPGKVVPVAGDMPKKSAAVVGREEQKLLDRLHREQATIESMAKQHPSIAPIHGGKVIGPSETVTETGQTDKLELAQSGNDFSVATISQLANRKQQA